MPRILPTLIALAFAVRLLAAPVCACSSEAPMAAAHSCCKSNDARPVADGHGVHDCGDGVDGCCCDVFEALVGQGPVAPDRVEYEALTLPWAAPASAANAHSRSHAVHPAPPQWSPPRARDRLVSLQTWLR